MKKELYREVCVYNFISKRTFNIEKGRINMLSIEILFKLYDLKTGKEILFDKYYEDEVIGILKEEENNILISKKFYLSDYIDIFADKNDLYKIVKDEKNLSKLGYKIDFEIIKYYKYSDYSEDELNGDIEISKDIFLEALKKNIDSFLEASDKKFKLNLPISYKNHYKIEYKGE